MSRTILLSSVVIVILLALPLQAFDDEVSLFNSKGKAVAYVADDLTIYLWSGTPVCYLKKDTTDGFHIYGFNGKHLGWLVKGIIRDHQGHAVGAVKEAFSTPTDPEPFKGFKRFKPFKSFTEFAPFRPFFDNAWSEMPLKPFLLRGVDNEPAEE